MSAERPLLVTNSLVPPILRGGKTNTRRLPSFTLADIWIDGVGWTRGDPSICDQIGPIRDTDRLWGWGKDGRIHATAKAPCAVGDVLWVRETWSHTGDGVWSPRDALHAMNGQFIYRATDPAPCAGCWFPSIHMPRKAARIFLRVEDVRVERVQDITEEDARAEGVLSPTALADLRHAFGDIRPWHREAFAALWDSLAPAGSKWADNPWVWVIRFKLETPNVR